MRIQLDVSIHKLNVKRIELAGDQAADASTELTTHLDCVLIDSVYIHLFAAANGFRYIAFFLPSNR